MGKKSMEYPGRQAKLSGNDVEAKSQRAGTAKAHGTGGMDGSFKQMPSNSHHDSHIGAEAGKSHLASGVDLLHKQHDPNDQQGDRRPAPPQHRDTPSPIRQHPGRGKN